MKVFFSYAQADKKWAEGLREKLREAWHGADEELDIWNPAFKVAPGENWALKYGRALENADALVILLSPNAVKSDWVKSEIDFALTRPHFRNKVIAVMARPTTDVPWILERFPVIKSSKDQAKAARELASALKKTRRREKR